MYFWNSYPFVRLSLALIAGIICYDAFPLLWEQDIIISISGIIFFCALILISDRIGFYKLRHANGLIALLLVLVLGGLINKINYHSHSNNHYRFITDRVKGFSGTIVSPVNERTNHFRYDFRLENAVTDSSSISMTGLIHLYVKKDTLNKIEFQYGDHLLVQGSFYPIPGPDNPNEFDYRQYLARQNIYSHSFVDSDQIKWVENTPPNWFLSWSYSIRDMATDIVDEHIPFKRENGITKALLLGIKDHLDNDIKKSYSAAGAMHVLAVSGLHVGIVYMILQILIGRLRQKGKIGKRLFGIISVIAIWSYATITGLSPSVLRAATMFSLVAFSQIYDRSGNIYNTLGFAAFLLLLYDPYLIYSVGFQLSFAAVIGIVYIQPKLYRLLDFKLWFLDKAWAITCVSIAAQLATFPLSAYYFHQFPTYFLASNLIVIPAAFLMLVGGLSMLFMDMVYDPLGEIVGNLLNHFIWGVNEIISVVDVLPNSLIEWIYMDRFGLVSTYLIVMTLIVGLHYRSFKTLVVSVLLFLSLLSWSVYSNYVQSFVDQLVFFEVRDKTVIDYIDGHKATLNIDEYSPDELELLSFQINPSRLSSHLRPISETVSQLQVKSSPKGELKYGQIGGKRMIIFDSTTFHLDFRKMVDVDIVLINNQSVKSLKWLKEHFNTKLILIGNKNSSYFSRKMKAQAAELNLDLHSLKEDGALILDLGEGIKKERTIQPAPFTTNPD